MPLPKVHDLGEPKEQVCTVTIVLVAVVVVLNGFCEAFNCLIEPKAIFEIIFKAIERTTLRGQGSNVGGGGDEVESIKALFFGYCSSRMMVSITN